MRRGVRLDVLVAFLAILFVSCKDVSAITYSSSSDLKFTFLPTISVVISPNTGFIINELNAGNAAYSNTVTISVDSNSSDGFVLSATVGKTNDNNRNNNRLVHTNNTDYFEGIATNASLTLSNLGSNKWGYSTYDTTNEGWSDYSGLATVGNTGTTLLTTTSSGTTSIDMKIGASAAANQVSGTFTNDINFTATARVVTYDYNITFVANHSGTVTNMPANVSNASFDTGDAIQISSTTPAADDSIFLGWCDSTVSGTTCTGNLYQPGDYIKLANASSSTTNTITLTAVWNIILYMQDMTLADCSPEGIVVYDKRDDTPYIVKKLADNKCWMLENLALDLTALTQAQLYGTGNDAGKMTNASNEALGYLKGATTGTSSDKWAMAAVEKTWTSSYSYSQPWIAVDSTTSGGCNNAYCVDGGAAGSPWSYDSVTSETINGVTSIVQGKIGVYYNYCAASAGSYCWGSTDTSSSGSPSSDPVPDSIRDITDDICPYGWRLPTGGSTGEFQNLYDLYSSGNPNQVTALQTALSTPLSGFFSSGKAYSQGNYGYFWSSTWLNTDFMNYLLVSSSNVYPSHNTSRYYGDSVRCVKTSDGYMQDFTLADAADGVEYTLEDKRDNNTYTVKKINGELWMTQNLRYLGDTGSTAGTMTIGSNNSNVENKSITLYSLDSSDAQDFGAYSGHCDSTNGFNYACVYDSGSTSTGVWYNYYAASAGTISTNSNSTAATSDICPSGWKLPTGPHTTANTDFNKLVGNTTAGWQAATAGLTAFSAVAGGNYYSGSLSNTGYGHWWSATASNAINRYYLYYDSSNGQFTGNYNFNRYNGLFVRCVRSS